MHEWRRWPRAAFDGLESKSRRLPDVLSTRQPGMSKGEHSNLVTYLALKGVNPSHGGHRRRQRFGQMEEPDRV